MNQQTVMLALFVALGVVLVTGLIAIPVIEEAFADNGNHFGQHKNGNNGHHRSSDV